MANFGWNEVVVVIFLNAVVTVDVSSQKAIMT